MIFHHMWFVVAVCGKICGKICGNIETLSDWNKIGVVVDIDPSINGSGLW